MAQEVTVKVAPDLALEHVTISVTAPDGTAFIKLRVNTRELVQAAQGVGFSRERLIAGVLVR